MSVFQTYSKVKNGLPDVFTYDKISLKLKVQVYHIWTDYFRQTCYNTSYCDTNDAFEAIHKTICREHGKKSLSDGGFYVDDSFEFHIGKYFDTLYTTDLILDVIGIIFFIIESFEKHIKETKHLTINYTATQAINDLNTRFKENGVGYEYVGRQLIRIDNKLLHKETIQKTLALLSDLDYKNVSDEFLKAHEHFRFKRNSECLNECLKAFESTIKIVCHKNSWEFEQTTTAKPLINILISKGFFKDYHQSQLSAIKQLLESSIPTIRNKNSAHGSGTTKIIVPDHLANYMLYLTGATIQLIVATQNQRTT